MELPSGLSPSKVSSFKDCALAFRYGVIDRIPEPPAPWTAKGSLVHRALERLFVEAPADRTIEAALHHLELARPEVMEHWEYADLELSEEEQIAFFTDAEQLVRNYFLLEDPTRINAIGPDFVRMLAAPVADARVEVFDGLGHFGPMQDPDRVAASIRAAFR